MIKRQMRFQVSFFHQKAATVFKRLEINSNAPSSSDVFLNSFLESRVLKTIFKMNDIVLFYRLKNMTAVCV